jgi:hypothetical protein
MKVKNVDQRFGLGYKPSSKGLFENGKNKKERKDWLVLKKKSLTIRGWIYLVSASILIPTLLI